MFLIKAKTGNFLLDVKGVPLWTPHHDLAMKVRSEEGAEAIKEDLQTFWGVQVEILPVFEPSRFEPARDYRKKANRDSKLSPFAEPANASHFEYTL